MLTATSAPIADRSESRSPQLVPQSVVSQQSAMPLVRSPQLSFRVPLERLARLLDEPSPEPAVFFRSALVVGLLSLFHPVPEKTLLDGSAQPCADSREATSGVPGVHVYAFNANKVPAIRKSLFVLDTLEWENGDPAAMRAAAVEYD